MYLLQRLKNPQQFVLKLSKVKISRFRNLETKIDSYDDLKFNCQNHVSRIIKLSTFVPITLLSQNQNEVLLKK